MSSSVVSSSVNGSTMPAVVRERKPPSSASSSPWFSWLSRSIPMLVGSASDFGSSCAAASASFAASASSKRSSTASALSGSSASIASRA